MIDRLIAELDERDGDPDLEADDSEDSFALSWWARGLDEGRGPGCPVFDPDLCTAGEDNLGWTGGDGLPCDPEDAEDCHDAEEVGDPYA